MIFPPVQQKMKVSCGKKLLQFGLAVGFPCNAIFKNNPEQK